MTPAQKAQQTAYNEFIADYVERHGECKATRDEAHEVADWVTKVCRTAVSVTRNVPCFSDGDVAGEMVAVLIDSNSDIDGKDEAKFLSACAIAAALEVVV